MRRSIQRKEVGSLGTIVPVILLASFIILLLTSRDKSWNVTMPEQQVADDAAKQASKKIKNASFVCMQAVRVAAKFPDSVKFIVLKSRPPQPRQGGGWIVRQAFESKNSVGSQAPQMARCEVKNGKLMRLTITNR